MELSIARMLCSIKEIKSEVPRKRYVIFIDTATSKEKNLVAVGDYIAAEKIVKLQYGGNLLKIEFEYEVRLMIEILFEKDLINQPTYLNIIRNYSNQKQKKSA